MSLPSAGTLEFDFDAVEVNQTITREDLLGLDNSFFSELQFVLFPDRDGYGAGYTSFDFKVSDGVQESAATYTMTIDVTGVQDPATGEPSILGTALVGETLTAGLGTVADVDGLPSSFTYQWIRVSGGNETDITDAQSSTYTLTPADRGNKVKVKLGFTDEGGTDEARTSDAYPATGSILNPAVPGEFAIAGLSNAVVAENAAFTSATPTLPGAPIGTVTWTLEGADAGDFTINSSTGVVSMVARDHENPVDADTDNVYDATVKATDSASNDASSSFTVTVTDVIERASLSITGLSNQSVAENTRFTSATPSISGTPIGDVTWRLSGTDAGDFTLNASTGIVSMVARDHENPADANSDNVYRITVTATDADGNSASGSFTVTVTDVVATLSVTGLSNRSVAENAAFTSPTPTLTGTPDGDVTWTLEGVDAGDFTVNGSTGVVSMAQRNFEFPVDANRDNVYLVTLKASDDDGSATASFAVTVTDVQEVATIRISGLGFSSVAENAVWTSSQPQVTGAVGSVTWSKSGTDAGEFGIDATSGVLTLAARDFENPADSDMDNAYEATVTATDADDNTESVSITVRVIDVRESASLGITGLSNGTIAENRAYTSATPTLTGMPIGDVIWSKEGTDAAEFTIDSSTGELSMVARNYEDPADANTDNAYAVTVKVTDEDENTATRAITVTVTDVQEAATITVSGLSDALTAENVVWTSATPSASGAIGDVTWSKSGTDAGDFEIDSSNGILTLAAQDFENPADANTDNGYEVTVTATDEDGNTESTSIEVTVTDAQETVTFGITGLSNRNVAENTAFTSPTPRFSGSPIGDVLWSKDGDDAADFTIDTSNGVLSMVARDYENPADFDTDNVYAVAVTATDDDENTATASFTVTVTDVRETATLAITGLSNRSVAENAAFTSPTPTLSGTPIGSVTWSKEGTDAADFTIDSSNGVLSMVVRDYEDPADANRDNAYAVTVKASDDDGNTASTAITVSVTDVRETATLDITGLSNASTAENATWTSPTPTLTGTPIGTFTWSKEGVDAAQFTQASNGRLTLSAKNFESPADDDGDNAYEVTVKATDADDNTAEASVTVTVTDVRESSTLSIRGLSNASTPENSAWTSATPTVSGAIGAVTWSTSGADATDFGFDTNTGVLTLAAQDYENPVDANTDNAYAVTVTATDADDNTRSVSIAVTVTDSAESSTVVVSGVASVSTAENAAWSSAVPTVSGAIGSVTWSKSGSDAGVFRLAANGQLTLPARDYENPTDANTDNDYEVTLRATDADNNADSVAITVTVDDVTETATITIGRLSDTSTPENADWTSSEPTASGAIGAVTWNKSGTDAADFGIDADSGVLTLATQDFENPADADTGNDYEVTVTATDADNNTKSVSITVWVTDVRESSTLTITGLSSGTVDENSAYTSPTPTLTGT